MNNNQFFDFAKSFNINPETILNFMKQSPTIDYSSFTNMVKKNSEALTSANQVAAASVQSIIKRATEIYQDNATHMFNTIKDMAESNDLEQATAHHQNYLKSSFENTMNNTKEIMDMASKASMEIFQAVGQNMSENINKVFQKDKSK